MATKAQARAFLEEVVCKPGVMPRTARQYHMRFLTSDATHVNMLGFNVDMKPFEGKVVDANDDFVVIKETKKVNFLVADKRLLASIPDIGSTVLITPYARRGFDGMRIDTPRQHGRFTTITIGESKSELPLDVGTLQSSYLKDMIGQIYKLKCPDGQRNLSNALVDLCADHNVLPSDGFSYRDPADKDCVSIKPAICVTVKNQRENGSLVIEYDRSMDYYSVILRNTGCEEVARRDNVAFDELAATVVEIADDGLWQFAKVETVKAAPKQKKAA